MEKLYNLTDAWRITGVTRKTLLARINRGEISATRKGKRFLISAAEMNRCFPNLKPADYSKAETLKPTSHTDEAAAVSNGKLQLLELQIEKLRSEIDLLQALNRSFQERIASQEQALQASREREAHLLAMLPAADQPEKLGFGGHMKAAVRSLFGK